MSATAAFVAFFFENLQDNLIDERTFVLYRTPFRSTNSRKELRTNFSPPLQPSMVTQPREPMRTTCVHGVASRTK
jgi:hypothetical protein